MPDPVFEVLKAIIQPYAGRLAVAVDTHDSYCLNTARPGTGRRPQRFGAVQVRKSYVSFHLIPVYIFPELLANLSPALRARMQGKSCFNFRRVPDVDIQQELARLVAHGIDRFAAEGLM